MQPRIHLIRQVVVTIIRVKKARRRPTITAPKMLVAANVIPRRITAVSIVPKIPAKRKFNILHTQSLKPRPLAKEDARRVTARYTTAIPKSTHKKAGVTVIAAVIFKRAATIPIITLTITAKRVQLNLQ